MGYNIMPRSTVESIVEQRNRTLELYAAAYESLAAARDATVRAGKSLMTVSRERSSYTYHSEDARRHFLTPLDLPERDAYLATARRLTDIEVWSHIIAITDLERLMDKKAKEEFRRELQGEPPEVTVDNVWATLERLYLDRDLIFKRGIAECFSGLDRRFRSHDGWKIGSRVILSYAFDEFGSWSFRRNHADTIMDIERTFMVLEGLTPPDSWAGLVGKIDEARRGSWGRRQTEIETEYFRVRIFKNGNAHIWFRRDDLLEKVNQLLGEYYGAPIPEEREPEDDGGLFTPKSVVAHSFAFYPTPDAAADLLFRDLRLWCREGEPALTVLEPSAGTGNLAARAAEAGATVDCVEIQPHLADHLRGTGRYRRVTATDFLDLLPDPDPLYDRIIMNPPFDRERDIDHVIHALDFLAPNGQLVAIISAGTEFRETRKSIAFRALMEKMNASWTDMPAGSFSSVGTNCNTVILRVWKDGRRHYY